MRKKIISASILAAAALTSTGLLAEHPSCSSDLDKETLCTSSEGILSFHNGEGVILTAEVVGEAKAGVSQAIRAATNQRDGRANMEAILENESASQAANKCLALGDDWYLPASQELHSLYRNTVGIERNTGLNNRMFITSTFNIDPFGGHAIAVVDATGNALFPGISGQSLMSNSKDYSVVCAKHIN